MNDMEYKKNFRKLRLIILLPLIPAVAAVVLALVTDKMVFGYIFVAAALLFALLHVILWRCPECGSYMGRGLILPADGRCPMCGKPIAPPETEETAKLKDNI